MPGSCGWPARGTHNTQGTVPIQGMWSSTNVPEGGSSPRSQEDKSRTAGEVRLSGFSFRRVKLRGSGKGVVFKSPGAQVFGSPFPRPTHSLRPHPKGQASHSPAVSSEQGSVGCFSRSVAADSLWPLPGGIAGSCSPSRLPDTPTDCATVHMPACLPASPAYMLRATSSCSSLMRSKACGNGVGSYLPASPFMDVPSHGHRVCVWSALHL